MLMTMLARSLRFGGAVLRLALYAAAALALAASAPPALAAAAKPHRTIEARPPLVAMLKPGELPQLPLRASMPLLDNWLKAGDELRGRTLAAASAAEIVLKRHEVILSFDDGPATGRTEGVLKILDRFGVKAIFMMVGKMAELHPRSARAVALDGMTIGTHTYNHPDLARMTPAAAFAEIAHGQQAVAAVLASTGVTPGPFFRFPYLASTWLEQAALYAENVVVMPVNIDSDDYMRDSPRAMLKHLLARLDREGKGIVLFHDIHPKTLIILPQFLDALAARGYKIVQLVPRTPGVFTEPAITASTD
jgi:peptidoglycan/xylan/chitin deacetylase (PgdA/CDA1 family)